MLGVVEAIGHQAVADWAAFIKRNLEGTVSVWAIKGVAKAKSQSTSGYTYHTAES
jgi:hypothetical protein